MIGKLRILTACLALALFSQGGQAQANTPASAWVGTWAASQQAPEPGDALAPADLRDATLRQIVHLAIGGTTLRVHLSQAGGLTPAHKMAILGEMYGVKTAWHGPGDVSPVGHTAQLHLDLVSSNFGIQEGGIITGLEAEIFKGCATFKDGYLYASDAPGWGIEVDGELAAKHPFRDGPNHLNGGWGIVRRYDGTVIKQ